MRISDWSSDVCSSDLPIGNALGNFQGFRGSGTDLTEKKRSEREINQLARYDTLTGLANRLHITDLLERALRNHMGQAQPCALLLLDLDRFKAVNDTRSEEHTSELQSLLRISYAVFCLKK